MILIYFKDHELYYRFAVFLLYKYIWLDNDKDRNDLDGQISNEKDQKRFLEDLTSLYIPEQLITYWYLHFNKSNITYDKIIRIAQRYTYQPDELWKRLYKKYVKK